MNFNEIRLPSQQFRFSIVIIELKIDTRTLSHIYIVNRQNNTQNKLSKQSCTHSHI